MTPVNWCSTPVVPTACTTSPIVWFSMCFQCTQRPAPSFLEYVGLGSTPTPMALSGVIGSHLPGAVDPHLRNGCRRQGGRQIPKGSFPETPPIGSQRGNDLSLAHAEITFMRPARSSYST